MFSHEDYRYGYTAAHFLVPVNENEDYGMDWPDGTTQLTKELHGYLAGGLGKYRKFDHLVNAIRLQWPDGEDGRQRCDHPIDFCKMGIVNTGLLRVLWACCYEDDLGVAGSASSGKTRPIAAYALIDWMAAPDITLTFICTTTLSASEDRIYGAIVQLYNSAAFQPGTLLDYKKCIVFGGFDEDKASDREYNNAIKCLAIENGLEGRKAIDTTRGRKNERVRLIIDELPEMGAYVIQSRVNLVSNENFQFIGIGNPNRMDDPHGELCRPKHVDGYRSINKEVPEWNTRTGKAIFLSGEWSANFLVNESDGVPFPYLTSRASLEKMRILCYGNTNSLEYMRNAIGFWSSSTSDQTVLTRGVIEAYSADKPAEWLGGEKKKLVGLDLGFTVGGDECVAHFANLAPEVTGRKVLEPFATRVYQAKQDMIFEDSIAEQFVDDCILFGVEPDGVGLDIANDGGKVAKSIVGYWTDSEKLKAAGKLNKKAYLLVAISSGGKPTERIVSEIDPVPCSTRYDRRVTEYWMACRLAVLSGVVKGMDLESKYVTDLCSRLYEKRKGEKLYLETKKEFKDRFMGKSSPDHGDGWSYLIEMGRRHGLEFVTSSAYRNRIEEHRKRKAQSERPSFAVANTGGYESDSWGERD